MVKKIIETNERFKIEFDPTEPKIHLLIEPKVVVNSARNYRLDLIVELCRIAKSQSYFDKPNGCHICVSMPHGSQPSGYIRLAADVFYQLHPNGELFLKNFSSLKNFYIST